MDQDLRLEANCEPEDARLVGRIAVTCANHDVARLGTWNTVTPLARAARDTRLVHWAVALTQSAIDLAALPDGGGDCAIGPNVTNFVTESPHETARILISLDAYLPGRIWCGVGSGDSAVRNAGLAPMSAPETLSGAKAAKRLLSVGSTEWHGQPLSLAPARHAIPVLVAAHGPAMLTALAEGVSTSGPDIDGVILGVGLSDDAMAFVRARINDEALDVTWNPAAFEVVSGTGEEDILFAIAQACHHYARALRSPQVAPGFFPAQFGPGVLALDKEYAIAGHGTLHADSARRLELAEIVMAQGDDFVSYMKDRCLVVGSHEAVVARLAELYDRGVRKISVAAFGEPHRVERAARAVADFNRRRKSTSKTA